MRRLLSLLLLGTLLPLVLLFLGRTFVNEDWLNHLWMVQSYANGAFPLTLDGKSIVGMPQPVFYGYLLYPILGLLARLTTAGLAVRAALLGLWALQCRLIYRAARHSGGSPHDAGVLALLTSWATYPLTCLYNRGALPEVIAILLLTCSLASWMLFLTEASAKRWRHFSSSALLATLAAGAHPITALVGLPCLGLLAGGALVFSRRKHRGALLMMLVAGGAAALVLSPWIVACLRYAARFSLLDHGNDYGSRYNLLWVKLSPIPLDWDSVLRGMAVWTPYLEAQLNVPLLVWIVARLIAVRRTRPLSGGSRPLLLIAASGFVLILLLSLNGSGPVISDWLGLDGVIDRIQFVYRLTTYGNLFLLGAALSTIAWRPAGLPSRRILNAAVLSLALVGLGIKLKHGWVMTSPSIADESFSAPDIPSTFYAYKDYAIPSAYGFIPAGEPVIGSALSASGPGEWRASVNLSRPAWVRTNVHCFEWNQLLIDSPGPEAPSVAATPLAIPTKSGSPSQPRAVYASPACVLALKVPAGQHRISARFQPPTWYRNLRHLSLAVLLLWGVLQSVWLVAPLGWRFRPTPGGVPAMPASAMIPDL